LQEMGQLFHIRKARVAVPADSTISRPIEDYRIAGLRMTSLARPSLGKERFEMLAFAVSVLNGCESCIRSHEEVLRNAGLSADKIHDLARLASVVKALRTLSAA